MSIANFGESIALQIRYKVLEDATKDVKSDAVIYSGRPVQLTADGVKEVDANVRPYGLAKANKNSYIDETSNSFGMYGSGKLTVVCNGIVEVSHNVYEVGDTSVTVKVYDDAQSYNVGDKLYVELTDAGKLGMITNQVSSGVNDNTYLGIVTKAPSSSDPVMQIRLEL